MSTTPHELATHLDRLLEVERFQDYGPNGLQVEGQRPIATLATAATASLHAIRAAAAMEADALLVHHGIFWGRGGPLVGMLGDRVRALMRADLSLLAYHLPLDAHPEVGNNAWLLRALELTQLPETFGLAGGASIGLIGTAAQPLATAELHARLEDRLQHPVIHCPGGPEQVSRIGVLTGGGQNFLAAAAAAGCQALITGETSEQTWHEASELGCHCLAAGHHATEDHAVHELGAALATDFGLEHRRIALANPL